MAHHSFPTPLADLVQPDRGQPATRITLVAEAGLEALMHALPPQARALLAAQRFTGAPGQVAVLGDGEGVAAVGGVADPANPGPWCLARLAERLPAGIYRLGDQPAGGALLGWMLAQYRFTRYRARPEEPGPRVLLTRDVSQIGPALAEAAAVALVRDLVNTPAEDMGPQALEDEAASLASRHGARLEVVRGQALAQDFPMIHAVGRAASRDHAPRLIRLQWGEAGAPRIALVGKGVTFDTGGLDIKPSSGMALMKKDMGGAAHALALAGLVMQENLPVRLDCLVPAAENAISGNAFRPGDVLASRKGLSVEITNTDAEGRLLLADALALACEAGPQLVLDFATLTGAARVALGPDLPALFARRAETGAAIVAAGLACGDPVWQLPLHGRYAEWLRSDLADLRNAHDNAFAGASVAALFLDRFVGAGADGTPVDWAHFDTFAWNPTALPGRPKGGEALGLRAAWHFLRTRHGHG